MHMRQKICKLGTLAHNRGFSLRDYREYTGGSRSDLLAMIRRGLLTSTSPANSKKVAEYYPTSKGWDVIEKSCRLKK